MFDLPPDPPKLWLPPKPAIIRRAPDLLVPDRSVEGMLVVNQLSGFGGRRRGADGGPATAEFIETSANSPSANSHTIAVNTGDPAPNKHVIGVVHYFGQPDNNRRIAAATMNGSPASILRQDVMDPGSSIYSDYGVAIIGGLVSSGDPIVNVGLTANAGTINIGTIGIYRVLGLNSLVPVATAGGATATSGSVSSYTRNVQTQAGGVVIAGIHRAFTTTAPASFTQGVSQDYILSSVFGGGHALIVADEASRAIRYERTSGSTSVYVGMSVVSLR